MSLIKEPKPTDVETISKTEFDPELVDAITRLVTEASIKADYHDQKIDVNMTKNGATIQISIRPDDDTIGEPEDWKTVLIKRAYWLGFVIMAVITLVNVS